MSSRSARVRSIRVAFVVVLASCGGGTSRRPPPPVGHDGGRAPAADESPIDCASGFACFEKGKAYFDGSEPRPSATAHDLALATRYFVAACEAGAQRGCNVAGNMYRHGAGVAVDRVRAQEYYRRACIDDTTPEACSNLAGVERELAESP